MFIIREQDTFTMELYFDVKTRALTVYNNIT